MRTWPGSSYPLGAIWDGKGVNFAVFAENASRVDLCLFDAKDSGEPAAVIRMPEQTHHVWHCYLPGVKPGQLYGYRVFGPYDPQAGLRFNPEKLLIDPYAAAIAGQVDWRAPVFGYDIDDPREDRDLTPDLRDDAWGVPKGIVVDGAFDWSGDRRPDTPWHETIIYETHVKGISFRHPEVPEELRGTYAGLAHPAIVDYLTRLGITAVELLPVHAFIDDKHLVDKGLRNYWGYNSISYFAPDARYSSSGDLGGQVVEFKSMVKTLHQAGLEVILDVVYNHTAEGNHYGPMLSFKGIDNAAYYRLVPDDPRFYMDFTGTGNSLNMHHPQTIKLVTDSLRYWHEEMHVDGFRFDLASTLARELYEVDHLATFFEVIHQDPVLSRTKLIAEPWDIGEGGYQVGNFPVLWTEWNGRFRDEVRRYWRGDREYFGEFATRLAGSPDLYEETGRRPAASINFITAHDGFTLNDLVSYDRKHNEENLESNHDGSDYNLSWNCGVEGPTANSRVVALRERKKRNFLATLFLSQGVPMLLGGDEISRTQRGNNNAYCQDNEISWYDWDLDEAQKALLEFTRRLIAFRRAQPVLRRRRFFSGRPIRGSDIHDVSWWRSDGDEMTDEDWESPETRAFGMLLDGHGLPSLDERGDPIVGDTLLVLFNPSAEAVLFVLPHQPDGAQWELAIDTASPDEPRDGKLVPAAPGEEVRLPARSVMAYKHPST